jgi:hypothetical protein
MVRVHRPLRAVLLSTFAACLISVGFGAATAAGATGHRSCGPEVVLDYWAPLRTLPPVNGPPWERGLPFRGGDALRLETSTSSVVSGSSTLGFWLTSERQGRAVTTPAIQTRTTLTQISAAGEPRGRERSGVQRLAPLLEGHVGGIPLSFKVGAAPALYRADTYFLDRAGAKLVHYAAYFRVVPRHFDARLGLVDPSVRPGGVLRFRLENLGTRELEYGYEYSVERREAGRWIPDPSSPHGFPLPSFTVGPGLAGICESFRVPVAMDPGTYRLSKPAGLIAGADRLFRATFSVSG